MGEMCQGKVDWRVGGLARTSLRLPAGDITYLLMPKLQRFSSFDMYGRSLPFLLLIRYSFSAPTPNRIPTLRVLLVRHGESENNVLPLVSRQHYENNRLADPELTAQGQLQVQQLGDRFFKQVQGGRFAKIEHLRQIYVSPMVRTLQTAEAIASSVASTNVPFTIARDCFEIGGCYEGHANSLPVLGVGGLTGADIKARFPFVQDEEETKLSEGWFHHATKESLPQAVTRVRSVVDRFATTLRTSLPPPPGESPK